MLLVKRLVQIAECSTDNDIVIKITNKRDRQFVFDYTECFQPPVMACSTKIRRLATVLVFCTSAFVDCSCPRFPGGIKRSPL